METGRASTTAQLVAGLRAAHHQSGERPLVFDDPFARHFTGGVFREPLEQGALQAYLDRLDLKPIQGGVLARARLAEDALERAMAHCGVGQLVLLGAGNDTFLLRRPELLERLRVFELDHPDSQAEKRARLRALGFEAHRNACFVAVDFERERAGEALARSGFDGDVPAFFNWLGVVTYLTREAFEATLHSLRAVSAAGSRIVFDYPVALDLLTAEADRARSAEVSRSTAAVGEPRRLRHDPAALARDVERLGYAVVEDLPPAALFERYFARRRDGLRPNPENRLIELRMT